jgi:5-methylcytosine-specific restriction endonuclease McrA
MAESRPPDSRIALITAVAETDATFRLVDGDWIGKCLICGGPLRFDAATGGGVTVEHIVPRKGGGSNDLLNLALTHAACNYEKGVNWDEPKRRRGRGKEYDYLLTKLLTKRRARWREPGTDV